MGHPTHDSTAGAHRGLSTVFPSADLNAMAVDPNNDSLHSMRLRRLESEAIRDTMLLAGTLDETRYGPSVAQHLTSAMTGRGRPGASGPWTRGRAPFTSKFAATFWIPSKRSSIVRSPPPPPGNAGKPVCLHSRSP